MTTRVRGRGTVRRLLLGASLAALAATGGAFAAPVAAADRLPDMQAERPTEVHITVANGRRLLKFTAVMVNVGDGESRPDGDVPRPRPQTAAGDEPELLRRR